MSVVVSLSVVSSSLSSKVTVSSLSAGARVWLLCQSLSIDDFRENVSIPEISFSAVVLKRQLC